MTYFSSLGLAEPITRALDAKGYADPTPIQRQAIPALLEGRDLLGIAQTGTGKTAAFALPSLHRLAADPQPRRPASCRMLVLSPTRELAAQIAANIREYAKFLSISVQCVFGGLPVGKQARALVPGCDVLVATPGRLLDLIEQRAVTLRNVEIFVLDEADQMMDLGFIHALRRIAQLLPEKRQSLFFSATMPQAIAQLGAQFIRNPVRVEVAPQATTAERVEQYATFVDQREKQALLTIRLRTLSADGSLDRALVFTRTKHGADRVVRNLSAAGVNAAAIHGNKSQAQRTAALGQFRSGGLKVLVATDIAARGIDVSGVSHVFNFELPNVAEQYVHRIGRTARAGADGVAESFVAPDERAYLRDIERLTKIKPTPLPLPGDFAQEAARLPKAVRSVEPEPSGQRGERRDYRRDGRSDDRGERNHRPRRTDGPRTPRTDRSAIRPLGDAARRADGGRAPDGQRRDGQRSEGQRFEGQRRDAPRRDQHGSDGQRRDGQRSDAPRPNGQRFEGQRSDGPRSNGPRSNGQRSDGPRPNGQRFDGQRRDPNARDGQRNDQQGRDGQRRDTPVRDGQVRDNHRRDNRRSDQPARDGANGNGNRRRFGGPNTARG